MRQEGQVGCDSGHICEHYLKRQDIEGTLAGEAEDTQAGEADGTEKTAQVGGQKTPESTAAVRHPSPQALPASGACPNRRPPPTEEQEDWQGSRCGARLGAR